MSCGAKLALGKTRGRSRKGLWRPGRRARRGLRLARGSRRRSGKPGEPQNKATSCKAPPEAVGELAADEEEDECVICCDRLQARTL